MGARDWSPTTLKRGQSVYSALEQRGIKPTRSLLLVIAERNEIADFARIPAGTPVWLPTAESVAEQAPLWHAAARTVSDQAKRTVELDAGASSLSRVARAAPQPAANPTTLAGLAPPATPTRAHKVAEANAAAAPAAPAESSDTGPVLAEPPAAVPAIEAPPSAAPAGGTREVDAAPHTDRAAAILAMNPEELTPEQVKLLPPELAPRLILLKGLFDIGDMNDLGKFFVAMGYPEARVKHPDGSLAISSHRSSSELAGTVAWYYEKEGVPPVLIGHSQGGYMATKVLYELAEPTTSFPIWNPVEGRAEERTTIKDPKTGEQRSPAGLRLPLTATLATGRLMRALLPWQWSMMPRLYSIPDTAERFLTFNIPTDVIGSGWEPAEPAAGSRSQVRNIRLPGNHTHIGLPETSHLASAADSRQFIDSYVLRDQEAKGAITPEAPQETNIIQAAELWRAVTRAWCVEAQRKLGDKE